MAVWVLWDSWHFWNLERWEIERNLSALGGVPRTTYNNTFECALEARYPTDQSLTLNISAQARTYNVYIMHSLKRIALSGRAVVEASRSEATRRPAVCIFCEHRGPTTFRQAFSITPSVRAEIEPRSKDDSVALGRTNEATFEQPRTPEFEFEIVPEEEEEAMQGQAKGSTQAMARRQLKQQALQKERETRRALRRIQKKIEHSQAEIEEKGHLGGYEPAKSWTGLERLGGKEIPEDVPEFSK